MLKSSQGSMLGPAPHGVLLAEQTSDEENKDPHQCESKCLNKKVCPATLFSLLVNCVSPGLLFRHQGQSGTPGQGLVLYCSAMVTIIHNVIKSVKKII
jgi:hypothetical protein